MEAEDGSIVRIVFIDDANSNKVTGIKASIHQTWLSVFQGVDVDMSSYATKLLHVQSGCPNQACGWRAKLNDTVHQAVKGFTEKFSPTNGVYLVMLTFCPGDSAEEGNMWKGKGSPVDSNRRRSIVRNLFGRNEVTEYIDVTPKEASSPTGQSLLTQSPISLKSDVDSDLKGAWTDESDETPGGVKRKRHDTEDSDFDQDHTQIVAKMIKSLKHFEEGASLMRGALETLQGGSTKKRQGFVWKLSDSLRQKDSPRLDELKTVTPRRLSNFFGKL